MLQDLQCFKTCNTSFASCKELLFKTSNASCKGLLFKTSNALSCNSSNVQQQQPSTFQCFISFECATAATFYVPTLHFLLITHDQSKLLVQHFDFLLVAHDQIKLHLP
eukprot:1789585-Rhodomonas_salina.1